MKKLLQRILAKRARAILRKYRPRIVGVTGSVGKSSTKEAIVAVLGERFHVRGSQKNYNTEFGLPLAIIGADSPGRSPFGWTRVIMKAWGMLFSRKHYPDILVLEMGADKPGDIAHLVRVAPPGVGVLTSIAPVHTEFFGSMDGVRAEKATLLAALPHDGTAILNADDEIVRGLTGETRAHVMFYGFSDAGDVRAVEYRLHYLQDEDPRCAGTLFKIAYGGAVVPVAIYGVFGRQHVTAALAAATVGIVFGMNLAEIGAGIAKYRPPDGRMNIVPGVKRTLLIDDTYNASPRATHEALRTLATLEIGEQHKRIAVLADMKELGAYAQEGHQGVGKLIAELGIDLLVTVGELAREIANGAAQAGMSRDRIFEFGDREQAGKFVQERMQKGDVVLIKGSQSMRMEYVVKELMAEPLRAAELLVRQDKEWIK